MRTKTIVYLKLSTMFVQHRDHAHVTFNVDVAQIGIIIIIVVVAVVAL